MYTFKSLCVVGLGYIGLPTAAVFAKAGLQVTGVDINPKAVDSINKGKAHIVEVDLDGLLQGVVANGAFRAQTAPTKADAFIIAVPTCIWRCKSEPRKRRQSVAAGGLKVCQFEAFPFLGGPEDIHRGLIQTCPACLPC